MHLAVRATDGLVITDMIMPQLGGSEIVSLLRHRLPRVAVLVMSGLNSGAATGDEIGDGFLIKPFSHDALLRQVHALLHRAGS